MWLSKIPPGSVIYFGGQLDNLLEQLRQRGMFLKPPAAAVNDLKAADLVGCQLLAYPGDQCIVKKKDQTILLCSKELTILPVRYFGTMIMYDHGNGCICDDPCKQKAQITATLSHENIKDLLPYLNATPIY